LKDPDAQPDEQDVGQGQQTGHGQQRGRAQQELAQQAAMSAERARLDAMIANMRADAERQQQLIIDQLNQSLFPPAPIF